MPRLKHIFITKRKIRKYIERLPEDLKKHLEFSEKLVPGITKDLIYKAKNYPEFESILSHSFFIKKHLESVFFGDEYFNIISKEKGD